MPLLHPSPLPAKPFVPLQIGKFSLVLRNHAQLLPPLKSPLRSTSADRGTPEHAELGLAYCCEVTYFPIRLWVPENRLYQLSRLVWYFYENSLQLEIQGAHSL